jgi:threonine dehydratase
MAKGECARLEKEKGWTNIPPYDDPYVIAGQATVATEILRQLDNMDDLDAVFVCVGGGGLLAGIATYIKQIAPPHVKVIGVETVDADALTQSFAKGERVLLEEVGLFSDGTAVRIVGEECWRLLKAGIVDEMVLVDNDEICAAIKDIFEGELLECTRAVSLIDMSTPFRYTLGARTCWSISCGRDEEIYCQIQVTKQSEIIRSYSIRRKYELQPVTIRS